MSAQIRSADDAAESHLRPRLSSSTDELADAPAGLAWWSDLAPHERAYWLQQAGSAVPADAWEEFKAREVGHG